MKKLPANEKRKVIATKWKEDEKLLLRLCAERRGMSVSAYLRWLVDRDKTIPHRD